VFFLFGLHTYFRTISRGQFTCPKCAQPQQYRLRRGRRFFTVFFLPLIPVSRPREHVRCENCKTRYLPDVIGRQQVAA
jgi:hypothetical protein